MELFIIKFETESREEYKAVVSDNLEKALDDIWQNTEKNHWLVKTGLLGLSEMVSKVFILKDDGSEFILLTDDYYENLINKLPIIRNEDTGLTDDEIKESFRSDFSIALENPDCIESAVERVIEFYEEKYPHIDFNKLADIEGDPVKQRLMDIQENLNHKHSWFEIMKVLGIFYAYDITEESLFVGPIKNATEKGDRINKMVDHIMKTTPGLEEFTGLSLSQIRVILMGIISEVNNR